MAIRMTAFAGKCARCRHACIIEEASSCLDFRVTRVNQVDGSADLHGVRTGHINHGDRIIHGVQNKGFIVFCERNTTGYSPRINAPEYRTRLGIQCEQLVRTSRSDKQCLRVGRQLNGIGGCQGIARCGMFWRQGLEIQPGGNIAGFLAADPGHLVKKSPVFHLCKTML